MRRKTAAAVLATGLLATVAACGGNGGESTEDVCNTIEVESSEPAERFGAAVSDATAAVAAEDQQAALAAVGDAQTAADDWTQVIRDGADDAEDEEFADALNAWADELEALVDDFDPARAMAGEMPDDSAMQAANDRIDEFCGQN